MLTRQDVEAHSNYFGHLLTLHIRSHYGLRSVGTPEYDPSKIAEELGVSPEKAQGDFVAMHQYLVALGEAELAVLAKLGGRYTPDKRGVMDEILSLDRQDDILYNVLDMGRRLYPEARLSKQGMENLRRALER